MIELRARLQKSMNIEQRYKQAVFHCQTWSLSQVQLVQLYNPSLLLSKMFTTP